MNNKELIQKIITQEMKIQFYKKKLKRHKHYLSQYNWGKMTLISLIIPALIGMKLGRSNESLKSRFFKYAQLMALTIFSQIETKLVTSGYQQLEQFIKTQFKK